MKKDADLKPEPEVDYIVRAEDGTVLEIVTKDGTSILTEDYARLADS